MAETYSAGVVTAYGAAVRGGYTGTYEEFCAEQAEFAENAAAVAQAKEDVETMQGQVEQAAATFTGTTVPTAVTTVQEAGAAQVQAVQSEGTMQAQAVETVGAQQTAALESAGSEAVDAVEAAETAATDAVTAAQTAAVQAVQAESTTQQAAIQTKGEETIASIPADYTALIEEVNDVKSILINDVLSPELVSGYTWAQGALDTTSGTVISASSARRVRSSYVKISEKPVVFSVPTGYQYRIFKYSNLLSVDPNAYLGYEPNSGWLSDARLISMPQTNYIRIVVRKSDDSNLPVAETPTTSLTKYTESYLEEEAKRLGLHTVPKNIGVLNMIKRSRQLTDMQWEAIYQLPRTSLVTNADYSETGGTFEDYFSANKTYEGLPYSKASWNSPDYGYGKYYIGGTVNIEAFLSSLFYNNSSIATLGGYDGSSSACFYGTTCATFTAYVIDCDPYATTYFENDRTLVLIGALVSGSTRLSHHYLELGDILGYVNHHAAIITDIITENDELKYIEVSESTKFGNYSVAYKGGHYGGKTRRKLWTADEFYTWFRRFNVYRFVGAENVAYTPNPEVDIPYGLPFHNCPALPCIPFMGNKFNYIYGKIPNSTVLVNDVDTYTHLIVEKDGAGWNADGTTAPYPINGRVVEVGFSEVGQYKAYLVKMSGDTIQFSSKPCFWNVCSAEASASLDNGVATIVCRTTGNNKPRSVLFGSSFPARPTIKIEDDEVTDTPISGNIHEYTIVMDAPSDWTYTSCILLLENEYSVWHTGALSFQQ